MKITPDSSPKALEQTRQAPDEFGYKQDQPHETQQNHRHLEPVLETPENMGPLAVGTGFECSGCFGHIVALDAEHGELQSRVPR